MNTCLADENIRILIVDNEQDFARGVARLILGHFANVEVLIATSAAEALQELTKAHCRLLITDLRMPKMGGMQLLEKALAIQQDLSIVVLSAYGTIETAVQALRNGAYDFLTKPIESEQLFRVVAKGLERSRLLEENNRLRQLVHQNFHGELIGESPAMQQIRRSIEFIAKSDYTVLILGESGTGKELAARLVHRLSSRADKAFLAVDCPSIPTSLLESELFGYLKGSFTGATRDHKGLFVAADGGTILLDEIGDIDVSVQTKLLRCLQDNEIRPIGSSHTQPVDVRVIASTNRDLEEGLRNKAFREDLYYRLNVLTLTLPPLRDRIEDIPLLAAHFFHRSWLENERQEKEIDPNVLCWLSERPWPGNIRELQNFVRRLTVFCSGERVDMDLVGKVADTPPSVPNPQSGSRSVLPAPYKQAKYDVIHAFTRDYIHHLLTSTNGNISEAARLSGLSRVALQKILARLGDDAGKYRSKN
jgi:DNA-binding NtrC family response regulator